MKLHNLTPHPIEILDEENKTIKVLDGCNTPPRISSKTTRTGNTIERIPISQNEYWEVKNLPEYQEGHVYIVSMMICNACSDRSDLFIVNEIVRNEKGQIIGAKSIAQNPNLEN